MCVRVCVAVCICLHVFTNMQFHVHREHINTGIFCGLMLAHLLITRELLETTLKACLHLLASQHNARTH